LGCYLHGICDLEIWKDALHELKGEQNIAWGFENEFFCDHLDKKNQDKSLYIACFFTNFKKSTFC
jgi:hypothetical protein